MSDFPKRPKKLYGIYIKNSETGKDYEREVEAYNLMHAIDIIWSLDGHGLAEAGWGKYSIEEYVRIKPNLPK